MRARINALGRFLTALALAVSLSAIGFAHRSGHDPVSPDLAAYVASGGSLLDICDAAGGAEEAEREGCGACRIADAAALPAAPDHRPGLACLHIQKLSFVAKLHHHTKPLDPARLTRAPPQA